MALTPKLKSEIRALYSELQQALPGFKVRKAQGQLIADTAKTLAGDTDRPNVLLVEAGTGTGKTFGYLVPALPIAAALKLPVIVSSATVTLQQQLEKDLGVLKTLRPDLKVTTAYGRGRYFCRLAADRVAGVQAGQGAPGSTDDLFGGLGGSKTQLHESEYEQLEQIVELFDEQKWANGLRDDYPEGAISDGLWREIRCDRHTCPGQRCSYYRQCAFFRARREIGDANVVIANHNLLVANNVNQAEILPSMDKALVVIDEAHELPSIFRDGYAGMCRLEQTDWLRQVLRVANNAMSQHQKEAHGDADPVQLRERAEEAEKQLKLLSGWLFAQRAQFAARGDRGVWRLEHGVLPDGLTEPAKVLNDLGKGLQKGLAWHKKQLDDALEEESVVPANVDKILSQLGRLDSTLDDFTSCWSLMGQEEFGGAPLAKWVEINSEQQFSVHVVPVSVSGPMARTLWQDAKGVLLCSATLTSLNSFGRFMRQAGLSDDATYSMRLPSPFDYPQQASLQVPRMTHAPSVANEAAHTSELLQFVRDAMEKYQETGGLVLFQSYRQMSEFRDQCRDLPRALTRDLLFQGDDSRAGLLKSHRERIAAQRRSVLVGVASLGLGLDLPGDQVNWVLIAKLPFPDFSAPLEAAEQEWVASRPGGNPFFELSLTACSTALCQQAGRLIRTEDDYGELIICDNRLIEKRYGQQLLDSLPPFRRV